MPRYIIGEVHYLPADRWPGDFAVRSIIRDDKEVEAASPEAAFIPYREQYGEEIGDFCAMGSRLAGKEFRINNSETLLVEVWPEERLQ